jgi:uncharacterized membrane protein YuzA (DUF378 family)
MRFVWPHPLWVVDWPTLIVVIVAGISLGLFGAFGFDAATWLFGDNASLAYIGVGACAIWQLCRQRLAD